MMRALLEVVAVAVAINALGLGLTWVALCTWWCP
ncbi:hypothetical protein [Pseudomonas phage phiH2]|uniref:Uncharacterized protein n=1 Tax=Pseudomonas phage phiH2 TaxID=2981578 RepID=A0A977TP50_9CAUD|nr:hypothetical protein P9A55_gp05 [Pseudomonas phage phiH2]UXX42030.1 hypothetical protein [Pseudomonas phage phiH2]WGH15464.1 hypothetical protein [Pseudomonas phage PA_LZ02]